MKYIIPIIGALLFFVACQQASKKPEPAKDRTDATTQKDSSRNLPPELNYVTQIPDSLKTLQQQQLARQLLEISIEHVTVADNHMVFDMSRKEFRQTGIPMKYYRLFKKNMAANNQYFKTHDINNLDQMTQEYRHTARKALKEKYNSTTDTTYFELQTTMVKRAEVEKLALQKGDRYRVNVQLKDQYRTKYAQATAKSKGQRFAITYHGTIVSRVPTIHTKITNGKLVLAPFIKRKQARNMKLRILGKD